MPSIEGENAAEAIVVERLSHAEHGHSDAVDDAQTKNELVFAAMSYALLAIGERALAHEFWPWPHRSKPEPGEDRLKRLVQAGSLLMAELERRQRPGAATP
jgi:hypothetical protein